MRVLTFSAISSVVLVVFISAPQAQADVYRCVSGGGHVSYQQTPCSSDSKPMHLKDRRSGWSALRPGERALLNSYRNEAAARRRELSARPKRRAEESKSCWKRRKQLEAVRSRLHRGYKLKEADELHRKQNNYEDYLRRFCASP
ncbi:MAG: DUF4124 domain-containing protein [Thiogranum sp.]|nr:DUF4124 domain-containing protein [Thiogranum sp.]